MEKTGKTEKNKMKVKIYYKDGFRFQLWRDVGFKTEIYPPKNIITEYLELYTDGFFIIKWGYAWDGPSGPCRWIADRLSDSLKKIYLKTILTGSLFHDGGYQLIRLGLLDPVWKNQIDKEFKKINIINGMSRPRAWWSYKAVVLAGTPAIRPESKRPILIAP